ncbi:General secretion pathway protein F [Anaerohalosphaera lusitana]|uniref:General secretion pathway protein F n=1 Tax=Anaerohalosphaera lusitana TaxID=1936003 RepID=A0A1U9NJQ8_9BACT|nr:type II secretion system F family protein [Anaerohalosphaera lusitana]AQT68173.1 General secretion pathway protein F [Anaerohalosphaera lusitana]
MASFTYKGVDRAGNSVSGTVEAADRSLAISVLTAEGTYPTELMEGAVKVSAPKAEKASASKNRKAPVLGSGRVKSKDILAVTEQLSTALSAGLPLLDALDIIRSQQVKPAMRELLGDLEKAVSSGNSLSGAMAEHSEHFSKLYVSMVRVGETGGILDETISQLATILEREEKIKTSMTNALVYPAIVLTLGIGSVIIMLTAILPKIINALGEEVLLPLPTRMLLWLSDFLIVYGWAVGLAVAGAAWFFYSWKNTEQGKHKWDAFKLRVPVLGSVLTKIAVGRFARTLGSLTGCGITILNALSVVRDIMGNEQLGGEIDEVASKVSMGESLGEPLAASGHFPPLLVQLVSLGEQTGKLDEVLLNAARTFDSEADAAITRFMAVFPALIILLLALIIFFIIAGTLLPIVTIDFGGLGV